MSQYTYSEFGQRAFAPQGRITWAVQRLIVLNILVFAGQLIVQIPFGFAVQRWLEFSPGGLLRGFIWMPFTYMFLHGGLLHLFSNLLWLFFFGPDVERLLSTRQFFRFYIFCGAAGVLATYVPFLLEHSNVPVVGASGAVMGVLVAYAMGNPEREFFLFPLPMPVNARALVWIVIGFNVVSALSDTSVSVATHFGGMLAGFVYMKIAPWFMQRGGPGGGDRIGEAVDNIFKFEKRNRR